VKREGQQDTKRKEGCSTTTEQLRGKDPRREKVHGGAQEKAEGEGRQRNTRPLPVQIAVDRRDLRLHRRKQQALILEALRCLAPTRLACAGLLELPLCMMYIGMSI